MISSGDEGNLFEAIINKNIEKIKSILEYSNKNKSIKKELNMNEKNYPFFEAFYNKYRNFPLLKFVKLLII